jgi:predicted lipoprotein with Yx(FWY)xxD motif
MVNALALAAVVVLAPAHASVGVRTTELGKTLVDGRGHTLYVFDRSSCTGACASTWPPFLTKGKPVAHGVAAAKLGTKRLAGGKLQVTFGGKALYFYVGDSGAGQVAGASVPHWAAVSPTGAKLVASTPPPSSTTTTPAVPPPYGGGDGY